MSNNLDLSQIAGTQLNKHITANDQAGELDAAITEPMAVPVDDTNAVTLTAAAFRRHFLFELEVDTTPPDDAITLTVPALKRGVFGLRNTTAHPVTVTISGQSADPPVVLPDEVQLVVCNGTDVLPAGSTRPNYGLLVLMVLRLMLTVGGGMILFTDQGLEWMYKQGIWARKSHLMNEKEKRRLDRYNGGGGFFLAGLITLVGSSLAFLSQWELLRLEILNFLTF